jgi:hypothetical protein
MISQPHSFTLGEHQWWTIGNVKQCIRIVGTESDVLGLVHGVWFFNR